MTVSDTVTTTLSFAIPPADGSKPTILVEVDPSTGERQRNFDLEQHEVQIENVRGREDAFSLDKNGFAFHYAPAKHKAFRDDSEVEKEYYPEVIEHIKKFTGASRVVIFDHSTSQPFLPS